MSGLRDINEQPIEIQVATGYVNRLRTLLSDQGLPYGTNVLCVVVGGPRMSHILGPLAMGDITIHVGRIDMGNKICSLVIRQTEFPLDEDRLERVALSIVTQAIAYREIIAPEN